MGADGCIDPAARRIGLEHLVMQRFTHTVQALKFKGLWVIAHLNDRANRVGVVGGKLRINPVGHAKQFPRTTQIGRIRRRFPREDGEIGQALDLCAFDLGVPIGPFDQPQHNLPIQPLRQGV